MKLSFLLNSENAVIHSYLYNSHCQFTKTSMKFNQVMMLGSSVVRKIKVHSLQHICVSSIVEVIPFLKQALQIFITNYLKYIVILGISVPCHTPHNKYRDWGIVVFHILHQSDYCSITQKKIHVHVYL